MEENTTSNRPLDLARGDNNKSGPDPRFREDDTKTGDNDTKIGRPTLRVVADTLKRASSGIRADLPRRGFTFEVFAAAFLLGILIRSLW